MLRKNTKMLFKTKCAAESYTKLINFLDAFSTPHMKETLWTKEFHKFSEFLILKQNDVACAHCLMNSPSQHKRKHSWYDFQPPSPPPTQRIRSLNHQSMI